MAVSGTVTAYVKATSTTNGYIVVGGVKYVIKAGVTLSSTIKVGAVVNLQLSLNGTGQITACAVVWVKVAVSGTVTAYVKATSLTNGYLAIGTHTYVVASGTVVSGVQVGLNLSLRLTLNAASQIVGCQVL